MNLPWYDPRRNYRQLVARIHELSEKRRKLYQIASKRSLTDAEMRRLTELNSTIPQLWYKRKEMRVQYGFVDQLEPFLKKLRASAT